MSVPLLVCDFDGTLALQDVGDALCRRLADPSWTTWEEAWHRREVSLPEAQRHMWETVRASEAELLAVAREVGALRPGAADLLDAHDAGRIELVLASGGFRFYIEALLGPRWDHVRLYANELEARATGAVCLFPHTELHSALYAVDKSKVIARHRGEDSNRRVIFVGDGSSDVSVTDTDAEIFAVKDRALALACNDAGRTYVPIETFQPVLDALTPP